jgi:hypothetical protein
MYFPQPQHPPGSSSSTGNQRVIPPPSRLSPPPGTSVEDLIASSDITGKGKKKKEDAPKRGYRACVHCRLRKARCDLGDVNSPSEPPCTRCRREQRNCVFLPSVSRPPWALTVEADGRNVDGRMAMTIRTRMGNPRIGNHPEWRSRAMTNHSLRPGQCRRFSLNLHKKRRHSTA